MPKFWGSIIISSSIFFRVRFWQCILENQKWWVWFKSKSISKVNASILKVFEPKFTIFAKEQYPSFSTSLARNVATWGLWYANTFVDFFFHNNDQHLETRSVFGPKVNMCHWSFSGNITLKRFAVIAWFLFLTWFP